LIGEQAPKFTAESTMGTINFPLVSDKTMEISGKYGMIHSYSNTTKDVRGVLIIDPDDKIRVVFFYPMEIGRNLDEIFWYMWFKKLD
jgi:alkyl hydroperoxide reductase subunit AhpC